jgi:hypothetical protein
MGASEAAIVHGELPSDADQLQSSKWRAGGALGADESSNSVPCSFGAWKQTPC